MNTPLGRNLLAVHCLERVCVPCDCTRFGERSCACVCPVVSLDEPCKCGGQCWRILKTLTKRVSFAAAAGGQRASERLGIAPATDGGISAYSGEGRRAKGDASFGCYSVSSREHFNRKDGVYSCSEVVSSHKKWNLLVEGLSLWLSERFCLGRLCGEHPHGERE